MIPNFFPLNKYSTVTLFSDETPTKPPTDPPTLPPTDAPTVRPTVPVTQPPTIAQTTDGPPIVTSTEIAPPDKHHFGRLKMMKWETHPCNFSTVPVQPCLSFLMFFSSIGVVCVDRSDNCEQWKNDGRCQTDQWVYRNCLLQCMRTDICDLKAFSPTGK